MNDTLNHGVIEVLFMWKSSIILRDYIHVKIHLSFAVNLFLIYQIMRSAESTEQLFVVFTFVIFHNNRLSCLWAFIGMQLLRFTFGNQVYIFCFLVYIFMKSVCVSPR